MAETWTVAGARWAAPSRTPGPFPFPANRMVFHFALTDHEGARWDFAAHFRCGSDEETFH